jgi:hypothetical protein
MAKTAFTAVAAAMTFGIFVALIEVDSISRVCITSIAGFGFIGIICALLAIAWKSE